MSRRKQTEAHFFGCYDTEIITNLSNKGYRISTLKQDVSIFVLKGNESFRMLLPLRL